MNATKELCSKCNHTGWINNKGCPCLWENDFNDALAILRHLVSRCDGKEGIQPDGSNMNTSAAHVALKTLAKTATRRNEFIQVQACEMDNEGNNWAQVNCDDYAHYNSLPPAIELDGVLMAKTGWNSDRYIACYSDQKWALSALAKAVNGPFRRVCINGALRREGK